MQNLPKETPCFAKTCFFSFLHKNCSIFRRKFDNLRFFCLLANTYLLCYTCIMLRYSKNIQVLKFSITLDNSFTAEELKELEKAVAIYKEAPKAIGYKSIVNAFIASAKLSKRWISETNITKMRRLLANAPSRPITILLRRQGLLEGTYTKETSNGRHGYTIYYEIEKILKRFSQLDEIGYMRSISLHKDGKMDWLYATKSEFTKDKAETKKAIRGK